MDPPGTVSLELSSGLVIVLAVIVLELLQLDEGFMNGVMPKLFAILKLSVPPFTTPCVVV